MDWKFFLPAQCPPIEARADDLELYRLTKGNPLNSEDFIPLAVELKTPHQKFDDGFMICCAHRLSVFWDIDGAKKSRNKYKKKFKGHNISKGTITQNNGMIFENSKPRI